VSPILEVVNNVQCIVFTVMHGMVVSRKPSA